MAESTMRLSDLCDFVSVQVNPANYDNSLYVGLEHVASGRFTRIGEGKSSDVSSSKYAFQAGDVLYGKLRPYLDKAIFVTEKGICTTELLVLRPRDGVDPRFLVGVVHSPTFLEHAVSGTTGVQHPRTSWNHIADFNIPAFDTDEQTKIATILWEVHDTLTANETVIEAGANLKRAVMRELFTKGLRGEAQKETVIGPVPESWELKVFGDVFKSQLGKMLSERARGGKTPKPYLRNKNVQWGRVDLSDVYEMDFDEHEMKKFELMPGDLLICEGGEIGRSAIWQGEISECYYQKALHRVRPRTDESSNDFLLHWMSNAFENQSIYSIGGASSTIAHLPQQLLEGLTIPLPRCSEQTEIVSILDAIDAKISHHRRKRDLLDQLFKSLLHKLMTGEIRVDDLDLSALQPASENEAAT